MAEGLTLASALQAADTLLVTLVLGIIITMFVRGDLLSRTVYVRLTEEIIQRVVGEVGTQILAGVRDLLKDWDESKLAGDVARLKRERKDLVEELEWENPHLRRGGG